MLNTITDLVSARPVAVLGGTLLISLAIGFLTGFVFNQISRLTRHPFLRIAHEACGSAWRATLVAVGQLSVVAGAGLPHQVEGPVRHVYLIVTIAAVSWLVGKVLVLIQDTVLQRVRVDEPDNRRARRMRTQLATLRRLTAVTIAIIAIAAILMSFTEMRTYGASVLASAGIAGVVAGLAAQTTLSNVFAGLQLVFTDQLRYDDVVVVQEQWGRVEELTLTYVVVHLWDERRLVLPATYFTTTPFENWTRSESRVLAAVQLYLDPSAPIPEIRAKAREIIAANPLWDQRDWVLQVTDTTEMTIVVRILASAPDASTAFDLRCDIREGLIGWLQAEHPAALPKVRVESSAGPALLPSQAELAWAR
ncbi:MAG: Small-conductance mechanosensitive channel [Marmoricola sp.]|nr:Small-conductance mechanosensitive channel [Marmoricola sp.]